MPVDAAGVAMLRIKCATIGRKCREGERLSKGSGVPELVLGDVGILTILCF